MNIRRLLLAAVLFCLVARASQAQDRPIVGLIPKAHKPIKLDGKLDEWDGAFATPVPVGHPDFANRGAEFLYLWDAENLYIRLRCLDQKLAHVGTDNQILERTAWKSRRWTRREGSSRRGLRSRCTGTRCRRSNPLVRGPLLLLGEVCLTMQFTTQVGTKSVAVNCHLGAALLAFYQKADLP